MALSQYSLEKKPAFDTKAFSEPIWTHHQLEQLEHLRSEDNPPTCLMITHTIESYWIPN